MVFTRSISLCLVDVGLNCGIKDVLTCQPASSRCHLPYLAPGNGEVFLLSKLCVPFTKQKLENCWKMLAHLASLGHFKS